MIRLFSFSRSMACWMMGFALLCQGCSYSDPQPTPDSVDNSTSASKEAAPEKPTKPQAETKLPDPD